MHLVMRYLCFFGIVKRQGVKRRMDKRSTSEEQKSGYLGLTRADEERHLADVISVAQQNLERAGADIRKVNEDLADLLETYDVKDKEGLALWNNATARLKENEYDLIRYEKARKKPYFGRIDFKDGISQEEETCYIGRAGIAKNGSEPVVLDWRAPIASVYYESSMGPCTYTVSSEGTYEMDLVRKRTYEIEQDVLKDFFDSDVVANDELLTKYLAKNKRRYWERSLRQSRRSRMSSSAARRGRTSSFRAWRVPEKRPWQCTAYPTFCITIRMISGRRIFTLWEATGSF